MIIIISCLLELMQYVYRNLTNVHIISKSKKISQSRKNNNDCRNTLHTMFSNYVLPTKMNCEVFEGCKYYDSQTMTESMRRTYLNHEKKIRDINKDVDLNMASNASVFSPHLKVLPSCVHVASQKETCTINKLCKDECNCFKCTDVTKPKCNTKTEILVAYLPNKMNGLTLNDRCCKTWECRPRRPIIEDECKDVCCAELVNAKSKAKRRSRDNAHCNNYKPTCAAHQSLATFEKDKLAPTLKERCCPRYKCEDTPVTTTSVAPIGDLCNEYMANNKCVDESSITCKQHESKLTIDKNTTSNILKYKCCEQYVCFSKPAECKNRKIKCLHDTPDACTSKGGQIKLITPPNVTSTNLETKCCGIERCYIPEIPISIVTTTTVPDITTTPVTAEECEKFFEVDNCMTKPICKDGETLVRVPINKTSNRIHNRCCISWVCKAPGDNLPCMLRMGDFAIQIWHLYACTSCRSVH